jgi:hypothetical protein
MGECSNAPPSANPAELRKKSLRVQASFRAISWGLDRLPLKDRLPEADDEESEIIGSEDAKKVSRAPSEVKLQEAAVSDLGNIPFLSMAPWLTLTCVLALG